MIARLLVFFFDLLYHSMAWTYDAVAWLVSLGQWRAWVMTVIPYLHGPDVLELGSGPGHLLLKLRKMGYQAVGLDESRQMIRIAGQRLREAYPRQGPPLARGVGQELPFCQGRFDTVVATFPAPYIYQPDTLAEIRRVLKPGTNLVILLAVWITGRRPVDRALGLVYRVTGETPDMEDERLRQLLARFEEAGLPAQVRWIEQPHSRLMLIEARKSADSVSINS